MSRPDRDELEPTTNSANSLNAITLVSSEWLAPDPTATDNHNTPKNNNNDSTKPNNNNQHSNSNQNTPRLQRRKHRLAILMKALGGELGRFNFFQVSFLNTKKRPPRNFGKLI